MPEGSIRIMPKRMLYRDGDAHPGFLSRFGDESMGDIMFSKSSEIDCALRGYTELGPGWIASHRRDLRRGHPRRDAERNRLPCSGRDPRARVREVQAHRCGGREGPLIALERCDRVLCEGGDVADGHPVPWGLHQEDLCRTRPLSRLQARTDRRRLREPRCGHAAGELGCAHLRQHHGVRQALFRPPCGELRQPPQEQGAAPRCRLGEGAARPRLFYDVVSTTIYGRFDRTMGIPPCRSRAIADGGFRKPSRPRGAIVQGAGRRIDAMSRAADAIFRDERGDLDDR